MRTGRNWWEKDWPKAFPEALMKGQRECQFCVFAQEQTWQGQSVWGWDQCLECIKILIHKELSFPPWGDRSYQSQCHCVLRRWCSRDTLFSLWVTSSYWLVPLCDSSCWLCLISPLQTIYKMLGFLISSLGIKHSLYKTSWDHLFYLLSSLRHRTFHSGIIACPGKGIFRGIFKNVACTGDRERTRGHQGEIQPWYY